MELAKSALDLGAPDEGLGDRRRGRIGKLAKTKRMPPAPRDSLEAPFTRATRPSGESRTICARELATPAQAGGRW